MLAVAARQWWVLVLQGVLGVLFGVLAILFPDIALVTLVYLFAAWAIIAGVAQLAVGWRVAEARGRSWPFAVMGVVSIVAGLIAAFLPGPTILVLVLLLGAWILVQGVLEVYTAWRIRNEVTGEWILALIGVAQIVVGAIILYMPVVGAVLTVALVAATSILGGIAVLLLGLRLRSLQERIGGGPQPAPGRA